MISQYVPASLRPLANFLFIFEKTHLMLGFLVLALHLLTGFQAHGTIHNMWWHSLRWRTWQKKIKTAIFLVKIKNQISRLLMSCRSLIMLEYSVKKNDGWKLDTNYVVLAIPTDIIPMQKNESSHLNPFKGCVGTHFSWVIKTALQWKKYYNVYGPPCLSLL